MSGLKIESTFSIGRFAPSPTGALHLGNLRTALASWLAAKARGGRWVIRVEDVDTARCRRELADVQLRELAALGLESDAPIIWQAQRSEFYRAALERLAAQGMLYRCQCSRKDLALLAAAPHEEDGLRPYPNVCRARRTTEFVADALRIELPAGAVHWHDELLGAQCDDPAQLTGDPLLHRRDGCFAYHLAVVVDDALQNVTEVVRGADLRAVTATQLRLQEALGYTRPCYAHLGLVLAPDGTRLGKRRGAANLTALHARGVTTETIIGWLGWSLGCLPAPQPCRAVDLVAQFVWSRVPPGKIYAPAEWC